MNQIAIMMSNFLIIVLYSFAAYGLSNMMVFGSGPFKIFEGIRNLSSRISPHLGQMFNCMMCLPANIGWACSLVDWFFIPQIALTPFNILLNGTGLWWLALLCDCAFTSGIVWFIHHIELFFENIAEGQIGTDNIDNSQESIEIHES